MKKTLLPSVLLLILVTGCGGNPATAREEAGPTPDPAETATAQAAAPSDAPIVEGLTDSASGVFAFLIDGADGEILLPAVGPGDVEGLRDQLGEDTVSYALVTVRNPEGSLTLDLGAVTVTTPEGRELGYRPAPAVIEEWGAAADGGESDVDVVRLIETYSGGALPGQTSEILMIGSFPEVPDSVRTVTVQPADGREAVEASVRPES